MHHLPARVVHTASPGGAGAERTLPLRLLLATAVTATVAAGAYTFVQQQAPTSDAVCEQFAVVRDVDQTLATLDPLSISGASTQLQVLHDEAPDAIRDDIGVLLAFTQDVVDAVEAAPGHEEQAVEDVARRADLDAVAAAGTAVQAFARDTCGLDLTTEAPPSSVAPPPTPPTATSTTDRAG